MTDVIDRTRIAAVLDAAATLIEPEGRWTQGPRRAAKVAEKWMHAVEALSAFALSEPGRTQAEVVAALRNAAEEVRRG